MNDLLAGRNILVVEDEMLILLMIEGILEDLGCTSVSSAATVTNAVSLIDSEVFDAAMLDMNLGGEDSSRIADALSEKGVPFIYCTGNDKSDMPEGFRHHAVLRKPFQDADLSDALAKLLS